MEKIRYPLSIAANLRGISTSLKKRGKSILFRLWPPPVLLRAGDGEAI